MKHPLSASKRLATFLALILCGWLPLLSWGLTSAFGANEEKKTDSPTVAVSKPVIVGVDRKGEILFENTKVSEQVLGEKLASAVQSKTAVQLQASREVPFQRIVQVLDICRKAGLRSVLYSDENAPSAAVAHEPAPTQPAKESIGIKKTDSTELILTFSPAGGVSHNGKELSNPEMEKLLANTASTNSETVIVLLPFGEPESTPVKELASQAERAGLKNITTIFIEKLPEPKND